MYLIAYESSGTALIYSHLNEHKFANCNGYWYIKDYIIPIRVNRFIAASCNVHNGGIAVPSYTKFKAVTKEEVERLYLEARVPCTLLK